MQSFSVIIPIYNEASTCLELLEQVVAVQIADAEREIIIVESNSSDGSRQIVQKFAEQNPVRVIYQDHALGKGAAVREGLKAAKNDVIIIQDADLEYDIKDYEKLLRPLFQGQTDFILGSRHLGRSNWKVRDFGSGLFLMSFFFNFGHIFFTWIFNMAYGQNLTDPATMFKVFRRRCLEGIEFKCNRFDFDFELVGKLILNGYHPVEIPVSYHSRNFLEGKKVTLIRDPLTWIRVILMTRLANSKVPQILPQAQQHLSQK